MGLLGCVPEWQASECVRILCSNFVHNGLLSFCLSVLPLPCAPTAALVDNVNQSKAPSKWPPFDSAPHFADLRASSFVKKGEGAVAAKWSFILASHPHP